jgi:hypothetical protein
MSNMSPLSKSVQRAFLCAGAGLLLSLSAQAKSTVTKAEFDQVKTAAEAKYDAALDLCKPMNGNANDVCKARAKLDKTTSVAMGEARYKGTPKAAYSARKDIADAKYSLAKEVCDDKSGNDKDVCRKEAKAAFTSDKSNADVKYKTREAIEEATEDKVDARYAVAKEKCDALKGDAKDACLSKAKMEFGK